jgi:hypothetical protein
MRLYYTKGGVCVEDATEEAKAERRYRIVFWVVVIVVAVAVALWPEWAKALFLGLLQGAAAIKG